MYGFIERQPKETLLGGYQEAPKKILQSTRDWSIYLPYKEYQSNRNFDSWGCVSFSALNNIEILIHRMYGQVINYSDRFLTVMSGTRIGHGNYFDRVADTATLVGLALEKDCPFGETMSASEFYSPIDSSVQLKALDFLKTYSLKWGWVDWAGCDPAILYENLLYGPLQASVYAWEAPVNGIYQRTVQYQTNHAITIFNAIKGQEWHIFDHYDGVIKRLAWDFYFGSAIRFYIDLHMLRLIKGDTRPEVYAVGQDGTLHHIAGELSFQEGTKAGIWGDWNSWEIKPQSEVDVMPKGRAFGFIH